MSTAVRVVSLLAFGQAVVFLALWLLVCASAGAAPDSTKNFEPALQLSTYAPTGVRDPIARVGASEVKVVPGLNFPFVLEGILYQPSNPSAVINGTLVTLNKTVTLTAGSAEIQVRAIQIDRDRVVLEAGTRKVDLHLNNGTPPSAP